MKNAIRILLLVLIGTIGSIGGSIDQFKNKE